MRPIYVTLVVTLGIFLPGCDDVLDEQANVDKTVVRRATMNAAELAKCGLNTVVKNGDFETPVDFTSASSDWMSKGWRPELGVVKWDSHAGRNNSGGIIIEASGTENDLAVVQTLTVDPRKFYRLRAWVKLEQVTNGTGANVCLYDTWTSSGVLTGTADWQEIMLEFMPPASGSVTIACRLGYWASTSTGKVYFDDVVVEEVPKFIVNGRHLKLVLDPEDARVVRYGTIARWVCDLDKAYEKYYTLMGSYPYSGQAITILSVPTYPGGWAVAGNPILWYKPYVAGELRNIEASGSWSFGILHELGHDFALENANHRWIWNEEMFANLRMYYVVDQLKVPILLNRRYVGTELEVYYRTDAPESYDNGIGRGIPRGHDGLMYTLLRIQKRVGWYPFIRTYRDLNASTADPATDWDKFNLFLDKLSHYACKDVRKTYPPGELEVIRQLFSGSAISATGVASSHAD